MIFSIFSWFKKKPDVPTRIEMSDIAAEYTFVKRQSCSRCKGPVECKRFPLAVESARASLSAKRCKAADLPAYPSCR
jgi:hypothetical protein